MLHSAVTIVGAPEVPRESIVVVGDIKIVADIEATTMLRHLTIRGSKKCAVVGYSSFDVYDVVVENSNGHGIVGSGTSTMVRCDDVVVRGSSGSGVGAMRGASVVMSGAMTSVHGNGKKDGLGMNVGDDGSTIVVTAPRYVQEVFVDNVDEHGSDVNGWRQ